MRISDWSSDVCSSDLRARSAAQGRLDLGPTGAYETPALGLLDLPKEAGRNDSLNRDALEKNARLLESVLEDFGVRGEIVKVRPGPVVTRYELVPAPGTKTSSEERRVGKGCVSTGRFRWSR